MIDIFGRLPVNMRSYIRHIIALPGTESAGSSGDNIAIVGTAGKLSIFAHEIGHSLDCHAYGAYISSGCFYRMYPSP